MFLSIMNDIDSHGIKWMEKSMKNVLVNHLDSMYNNKSVLHKKSLSVTCFQLVFNV